MKKYVIITILVLVIAAVAFSLFNAGQRRVQLKMATFVEITLNGPARMDFDKIFDKAFSAIDEVEKLANKYDKESQLSIVNREAFNHPVKVPDELYYLIEESINISKNTEGAFDVTATAKNIGYDNIILNQENKTVSFKKDGIGIDLSAIAKGYAVDKAVKVIKGYGIKSAVVNAGGDLYCIGKKNIFQKWNVGIKDPRDNKKIIKIIKVSNKAVATSGEYEQRHLIDPRTGLLVEISRNATVVAKNCTLADALATAMCVLGKEKIEKVKAMYNVDIIIY